MNIYEIIQHIANTYSSTSLTRTPKDEMEVSREVEENLNINTLKTIFNKERLEHFSQTTSPPPTEDEIDDIIQQHILENQMFEQQRILNEMHQQNILNQQMMDMTNQTMMQNMNDDLQMQEQQNQEMINQQIMFNPPNMF